MRGTPLMYIINKSRRKGICKICGKNKSDSRIDVQVNNFRGDDEVYNVHKECLSKIGGAGFRDILAERKEIG